MPHETATLFLALLAMAVAVGLGLLTVGLVASRANGLAAGFVVQAKDVAVELAAAIAVVAMLGSLYLSEIAGFKPCVLCWVQRGFMYPAAIILVAALVTSRRALVGLAGLLALVGLPVSIFHRWEQVTGSSGFCDADNPCSSRWVNHFGFMTIPTMAGIGFAGILALALLHLFWRRTTP